jgi:O-methyltransferase involved in polyketide biosynthesis
MKMKIIFIRIVQKSPLDSRGMSHPVANSPLPMLHELHFPKAAVRVLAACAASNLPARDLPFRDEWAGRVFERLAGDASDFSANELRSAALRTHAIDRLAQDYLARTPGALGVGVWSLLSTRAHRLHDARWIDVDSPQVARLRRFVLPDRPGWLQLATCACRSHWVDAVCGTGNRKLLMVLDESVLPMPGEVVMRLLDDISRRVPAGSELIMAFDQQAPLRPAQRGRTSPVLELSVAETNGGVSTVRYPRLRFVDGSSTGCREKTLETGGAAGPGLAHLRVV